MPAQTPATEARCEPPGSRSLRTTPHAAHLCTLGATADLSAAGICPLEQHRPSLNGADFQRAG